jgi:hypothetical protein
LGVFNASRNDHVAVHGLQRKELHLDQEPEDDSGPARDEEVLPALPEAQGAQRD